MVEKLNVKLKEVKEHDSTLFQSSGLAAGRRICRDEGRAGHGSTRKQEEKL